MTEQERTHSPMLLVGFEFTPHATRALDQALRLVAAWPSTRLLILWARGAQLEHRGDEPKEAAEERAIGRVRDFVQQQLASLHAQGLMIPDLHVEVMISDLPPERALPETAYLEGADMLVVGTGEKDTFDRLILGSVSQAVLRKAPCSVFVVREKTAVPEIAEAPAEGQRSTLGRRHTYRYDSRNARPGTTMPLLFPMG